MFIDSDLKAKLDALPDDEVREVYDYLSGRLQRERRPLSEVLASIRKRSDSLPRIDYRVVETIDEGREERWKRT